MRVEDLILRFRVWYESGGSDIEVTPSQGEPAIAGEHQTKCSSMYLVSRWTSQTIIEIFSQK